jgi:hypothetical protein
MKDLIQSVNEILVEQAMAGTVDFDDWTYENPDNPTVLIHGYGSMRLDRLKKDVQRDVKKLASRAKDSEFLKYNFTDGSALHTKIHALAEVEAFVSDNKYKQIIKNGSKR